MYAIYAVTRLFVGYRFTYFISMILMKYDKEINLNREKKLIMTRRRADEDHNR